MHSCTEWKMWNEICEWNKKRQLSWFYNCYLVLSFPFLTSRTAISTILFLIYSFINFGVLLKTTIRFIAVFAKQLC